MSGDLINGIFEALGGAAVWWNVRTILRQKRYAGFSPATTIFFASWGLWNLWYYPSLGQIWSLFGGIIICVGNLAYIVCLFRFRPGRVVSSSREEL